MARRYVPALTVARKTTSVVLRTRPGRSRAPSPPPRPARVRRPAGPARSSGRRPPSWPSTRAARWREVPGTRPDAAAIAAGAGSAPTGASRTGSPARSSVSVARAQSGGGAVASWPPPRRIAPAAWPGPTSTTRSPVANGSSVPVCPTARIAERPPDRGDHVVRRGAGRLVHQEPPPVSRRPSRVVSLVRARALRSGPRAPARDRARSGSSGTVRVLSVRASSLRRNPAALVSPSRRPASSRLRRPSR